MIHSDDGASLGLVDGDGVIVGNRHGEVRLFVKFFDGLVRGVAIAEGIWPNHAYEDGNGINTLVGAETVAPFGGAAFHDNKVWIRKAS